MKTDKNVRNARFLIASYWVYKVLNGGSIPKTTLNAVMMEKRASASARQLEKSPEEAPTRAPRRRSVAARAAGVPAKCILVSFLKKQRVF